MAADYLLSVPASPSEVRNFLEQKRSRFTDALRQVREKIVAAQMTDPRLSSIYKVYSRGQNQGGDEIKHPRKVRLKFNEYNASIGKAEASIYDVPDIVGFTIVVTYPSDIDVVNAVIDEMIDRRELSVGKVALPGPARATGKSSADPSPPTSPPSASNPLAAPFTSKHGRVMASKGYFACHYNVRAPGTGARPIVEIQVKTVLHDAWGAKTHDLTYKPSGNTDGDLLASFDLLGDLLANLDLQSDTLRGSIQRTTRVRDRKRAKVQLETLRTAVRHTKPIVDTEDGQALRDSAQRILAMTPATLPGEADAVRDLLLGLFERSQDFWPTACQQLCALAASTGRSDLFHTAKEAIETWSVEQDGTNRVWAMSVAALAAYGAGDGPEAIDRAEEALQLLQKLKSVRMGPADRQRYHRLGMSVNSSIAYYHADQVGSHEGDRRGSREAAPRHLEASRRHWDKLGLPTIRLDSDEKELLAALRGDDGDRVFQTLDNDAFVRIQTASTEEEVRAVRIRLGFLHENAPDGHHPLGTCLFDYHDYCARMRLAELETAD